jgi:putative transposase
MPQGLVFVRGGKRWHRDVVALYNLRKRVGDVSFMPFMSKESHDPPTVSRWLRVKSLHLIVIEDKMK